MGGVCLLAARNKDNTMKKMILVLAAACGVVLNLNSSAFGQEDDESEPTAGQMIATLRIALHDLGLRLDSTTAELEQVKAERDRLSAQIAEAAANGDAAQADKLRGELDTATAEKCRLVGELARLESENSELRTLLAVLERRNGELVAENTILREQVSELQTDRQVVSAPSAPPVAPSASLWSVPAASSPASGATPAAYQIPSVDPTAPYRTAYVGWHPEFVSPYSDVRWEDDGHCREVRNDGWSGTAMVRIEGISMYQFSPESGRYISPREAAQEPNVSIYFCSATSEEPIVTITNLRETSTGAAVWNGWRWVSYERRNTCSARFSSVSRTFTYGQMMGWCPAN
jgi:cell division protein FtsB